MSQTPTVVLSVLLASAAAAGVAFATRPSADVTPNQAHADLLQEVAELRRQNQDLKRRVDGLAALPAPAPVAAPNSDRVVVPSVSAEQVAAAVEAYLKTRGANGAAGTVEATASGEFDVETAYTDLVGTDFWSNSAGWRKAFASGRMDEVIARFEAAAKANPRDTKVQMQLASAYLAYVQMDQSKWQNSLKADKVFDTVLELEPTHWDARFTKAVSYTFYPDFLGKKKDAIQHFETLVTQQETMPVEASQAQTYLFLGNLLEARDPAKAREVWAKGARRHPDSAELAKKLGS